MSDPRYPQCDCVYPDLDQQLKKFLNGSLHVYYVCVACGARAPSPCPRKHVLSLEKWCQLLTEIGEEVQPL